MKKGVGAYTGSGVKLQGWQELWEGNAHQNHRAPMGPVKFPWASAGRAGNKCCLLSFLNCLQRFSQVSEIFLLQLYWEGVASATRNLGPSISSGRTDWSRRKGNRLFVASVAQPQLQQDLSLILPHSPGWIPFCSLPFFISFPAPSLHIIFFFTIFFYIHEIRGAVTWLRTDLVRLEEFNCI